MSTRKVLTVGQEIMTIDELCKWLKISKKTAYRLKDKGLPCIKCPGKQGAVRFDKAEVLYWLKNRTNEAV